MALTKTYKQRREALTVLDASGPIEITDTIDDVYAADAKIGAYMCSHAEHEVDEPYVTPCDLGDSESSQMAFCINRAEQLGQIFIPGPSRVVSKRQARSGFHGEHPSHRSWQDSYIPNEWIVESLCAFQDLVVDPSKHEPSGLEKAYSKVIDNAETLDFGMTPEVIYPVILSGVPKKYAHEIRYILERLLLGDSPREIAVGKHLWEPRPRFANGRVYSGQVPYSKN